MQDQAAAGKVSWWKEPISEQHRRQTLFFLFLCPEGRNNTSSHVRRNNIHS